MHGGSLRMFVEKRERIEQPNSRSPQGRGGCGRSGSRVLSGIRGTSKSRSRVAAELLAGLKRDGKRIAGYAATAKATTLLSYCDIDKQTLEYIVDLNGFERSESLPAAHPDPLTKEAQGRSPGLRVDPGVEFRERDHAAAGRVSGTGGQIRYSDSGPAIV